MSPRRPVVAALCAGAAVASLATSLPAQAPVDPVAFPQLGGQQVRASVMSTVVRGRVLVLYPDATRPDSMLVQTQRHGSLRQLVVPLPCVRKLQVLDGYRSRTESAVRGGVLGVAVGAGIGLLFSAIGERNIFGANFGGGSSTVATLRLGLIGGALGGIIGGTRRTERWRTQPLPAPPRPSRPVVDLCAAYVY